MAVERECFGRAWAPQQYLNELLGLTAAYPVVARLAGEVVGYGSIICAGGQGYIPTLGVRFALRRQGIASAILTEMLAQATRMGLPEVVLEVRTSNTAAQCLYRRFGFETVGTRPNYYQHPPDDAVVMRWTVPLDGPAEAGR